MPSHNFKFNVDVNVINHLGVGLYSSTPAALTELVANAWDADATEVRVTVDSLNDSITIEDDGHGMSETDLKEKFLSVGYSRRKGSTKGHLSASGKRRVMGRKGIGKLSMFALADHIRVSSKKAGSEIIGLIVDVPTFKAALENGKTEVLAEFVPSKFPKGHGTRIELTRVLKSLNTTESFLRTKLARRFSVIGDDAQFCIRLNGATIKPSDRNFYHAIQFLWGFDEPSIDVVKPLCTNLATVARGPKNKALALPCIEFLPDTVICGQEMFQVKGYIASVAQPKQLGAKEESANVVSIFANGRVFAEDVLSEANSAKVYQSYLVGEIHADFLDDDAVDRATASREAVKKDDPRYRALIAFIQTSLELIEDRWDEWRIELGLDKAQPQYAVITEWISTLEEARDRKAANKLMTTIQNSVMSSDEARNKSDKSSIFRGAILGFEKLRIKKQLDRLENISDVMGYEFAQIFASLDDVEETAYSEITKQRLAVIAKFAEIVNNPNTLEKVAQEYLANHLWLLDPTWDRVTGIAQMELDLTQYLRDKFPDSKGARLDISYRKSTTRHVVVELKKPSITAPDFFALSKQVDKYKNAVDQYYKRKENNLPPPAVEVFVLVSSTPVDYDTAKTRSMAELGGRIITYTSLINDSKKAYEEYLATDSHVGKLQSILDRLPE